MNNKYRKIFGVSLLVISINLLISSFSNILGITLTDNIKTFMGIILVLCLPVFGFSVVKYFNLGNRKNC